MGGRSGDRGWPRHPRDPTPLDDAVLAKLVVELADAVVVADTAGTIRFWNGAAERVFGWTAEQALGASLDLIIPERQRPRHWEGYERVMATGTTKYGSDLLRVPSLHADGGRRSIAFTVTLLEDDAGNVTGIAAVVRDETERWNEEQELRRLARAAADPAQRRRRPTPDPGVPAGGRSDVRQHLVGEAEERLVRQRGDHQVVEAHLLGEAGQLVTHASGGAPDDALAHVALDPLAVVPARMRRCRATPWP